MKSKVTLIVDGNWLLMSRMPALQNRYTDERTLMKEAKHLMIQSINIVLRTFPMIDNIIFVSDGGSWRGSLEIPDFIKQRKEEEHKAVEYKGNREKDEAIDWKMVFSEYEDMIKCMSDNGISAFMEPGIEGDDWCWYWSRRLNDQGTNVIIWTTDRDTTQLVNTTPDGYFTVVWDKKAGVAVNADEDITNFLLNPRYQANETILNDIISRVGERRMVSPETVRIDKIIRGDAGDNVFPAIIRRPKNGTSTRTMKVYGKDLPVKLDYDSKSDIEQYLFTLEEMPIYNGKLIGTHQQILEHIKLNRRLVVLDEKSYPKHILDIFHKYDDWYDSHEISCDLSQVEASLLADINSVTSILDEI